MMHFGALSPGKYVHFPTGSSGMITANGTVDLPEQPDQSLGAYAVSAVSPLPDVFTATFGTQKGCIQVEMRVKKPEPPETGEPETSFSFRPGSNTPGEFVAQVGEAARTILKKDTQALFTLLNQTAQQSPAPGLFEIRTVD
jgi:hypothetical protein